MSAHTGAPHGKLRVLDAARVGIAAVENACHDQHDWHVPTPCARWDALTLLRHLHAISAEYLAWIDDARLELVGHAKLKAQRVAANDIALEALPTLRPDAHLTSFRSKALRHLQFADRWWDLTVKLTTTGTWTVGEHVGIAAIEYHVHAWDLRRSQGRDHRAGDARLLTEVWTRHLAAPLKTPVPEGDDPWEALVRATGRDPGWTA